MIAPEFVYCPGMPHWWRSLNRIKEQLLSRIISIPRGVMRLWQISEFKLPGAAPTEIKYLCHCGNAIFYIAPMGLWVLRHTCVFIALDCELTIQIWKLSAADNNTGYITYKYYAEFVAFRALNDISVLELVFRSKPE